MDSTALATIPPTIKLCSFELSPGVLCSDPKIYSRGYCARHYSALRRAGAFTDLAKRSKVKDQALAQLPAIRKARRKLVKSMPDLIDALITGAQIEARKGKTETARWAALHTRVLEPVATQTNSPASSGVTINVGVKVSGTATMKED